MSECDPLVVHNLPLLRSCCQLLQLTVCLSTILTFTAQTCLLNIKSVQGSEELSHPLAYAKTRSLTAEPSPRDAAFWRRRELSATCAALRPLDIMAPNVGPMRGQPSSSATCTQSQKFQHAARGWSQACCCRNASLNCHYDILDDSTAIQARVRRTLPKIIIHKILIRMHCSAHTHQPHDANHNELLR